MIELLDRRRLFLPTRLSGCALWLRADLGVTLNGSTVSAWANQGTAGGSCSQGTGAAQPTWSATGGPNGKPTLQFDGGDYLRDATQNLVSAGAPLTVFAVCQHTAAAGGVVIQQRTNTRWLAALELVAAGISYISGNGVDAGQNVTITAGQLSGITSHHVARWVFNGTGNAPAYASDGAAKTVTGGTQGTETGTTGLTVGTVPGGSTFTGKISEIVAFSRALTAEEIAMVERYMGRLYAITVS